MYDVLVLERVLVLVVVVVVVVVSACGRVGLVVVAAVDEEIVARRRILFVCQRLRYVVNFLMFTMLAYGWLVGLLVTFQTEKCRRGRRLRCSV